VEFAVGKLVIPGVIFVGGYILYCGALMHGVHTVYTIFGPHDGSAILSPIWYRSLVDASDLRTSADALYYLRQELRRWRLNAGLAAIPPILILSRTTLADSVLPILPMLLFATSARSGGVGGDDLLGLGHWPPSAALSFAVLPYLRGAYNACYEHVWGARERRWLREIQPRAGAEGQDGGGGGDAGAAAEDGDNILEINVDVNILEQAVEWDDGPAPAPPPPPQHQQQQQGGEAAPANPAPAPAAPQPRQNGIVLSAPRLADTILGALIFPSIAASMGELLRLTLPKAWVNLPSSRGARPTGLLQTRWGRSIVGGCAFVVLKDAVMLYVKWRMARDHRRRRVVDYEKPARREGRA